MTQLQRFYELISTLAPQNHKRKNPQEKKSFKKSFHNLSREEEAVGVLAPQHGPIV